MLKKTLVAAALATVAYAGAAEARDQIQIVGSSTVFPFSTVVAELFVGPGRATQQPQKSDKHRSKLDHRKLLMLRSVRLDSNSISKGARPRLTR